MRWKTVLVGMGLLAALAVGCKQQCFLMECDYHHYQDLALPNLDTNPSASIVPPTTNLGAPPTVLNPDREPRHLTLAEALAMGLEAGTVGSPALNGTTNTSLNSFSGRQVFAPEPNIRAVALDPAIVGADIEASLAKFDIHWTTSMTWQTTDRPVGTAFDAFQAGVLNNISTQDASLATTLLKPLPTGGVAGITFRTDYEDTNLPARVNPSYRPNLQFQFEQPLLQGFGVEINQLRATHPGSLLTPFNTGGRVEGIVITRLRFDQQRAEFQRNVHILLVNIEVAYWNLYGSYWNLYSREQALRQAYEAYKINKERYEAGRVPIQELAQTQGQYELFRGQRITALGQVLENERALRALIGLPVDDCHRLVPVDSPTLTPYQPDWCTAVNEALALRPELILARQDLKFRQLDIINTKNLLLPDLRFTSTYDLNGIGTHLDGGGSSDANNALHSLATDKFNDWSVGLRMDVTLGYRDAHAALRAARLNLARSYVVLTDQENKATQFLALQYANLTEFYELIIAQRSQRLAAATQLQARFREFLAGRGTLDFLLEAQRVWADALRDEYQAIVQYNNSLISWEFAKGTILQHDNITIGEGPLPHCAQVRAVEHERQRKDSLVLLERSKPVCCPAWVEGDHRVIGVPDLGGATAPSVPALLEGQPPIPGQRGEELPAPRPATTPTDKSATPTPAAPTTSAADGTVPAFRASPPAGSASLLEKVEQASAPAPPPLPPSLPTGNPGLGGQP
jgi:outer membrane protein TolC